MKKLIAIILALISMLSVFTVIGSAVDTEKVVNNKYMVQKETYQDDSCKRESTYTFDSAGRVIKKVISYKEEYGFTKTETTNYTLDSKGNVTKEVYTSKDNSGRGYTETYTRTFDSKNNATKVERKVVESDGSSYSETINNTFDTKGTVLKTVNTVKKDNKLFLIDTREYTYDSKGRLIKEVGNIAYTDGRPTKITSTYSYNDYGDLIKSVESRSAYEDSSTLTTTYKYDSNRNLLSSNIVYQTPEGKNTFSTTYTYKNDQLIKESYVETYHGRRSDGYTITYSYEGTALIKEVKKNDDGSTETITYDKKGNILKEVEIDGAYTSTATYKYDSKNNVIEEKYVSEKKGKVYYSNVYKYTYDSNGYKIKLESNENHEDGGSSQHISNYSYDSNGNLIKQTVNFKASNISYKETYTWSYIATKKPTYEKNGVVFMFDNKATETGKAIEPNIYVLSHFNEEDNELNYMTRGVDYTLSYKNNVKPGKATITVKYIGEYEYLEPIKLTFTINPKPTKVENVKASKISASSLTLTWDKFSGAKKYKVEKSLDGKTWETVNTVDTNTTSVTKLKTNTNYQFRVTAINSDGKVIGKASDILKVKTLVTAPKKSKVTATTMTLTLAKISGAKTYKVEYSTDGKTWKSAGTFTSNEVKVTGLTAGTKYQFRARAYNSNGAAIGNVSASLKTETLCSAPTIKLTSTSSKTATVEITKVKGATKYVVATSTDNSTWKKLSPTTSTKYTIKNLAAGKKIYVKVQVLNSENLASSYSKVASVTVKK